MGLAARTWWAQVTGGVAGVVGLASTPLAPAHYLELVRPLASTRQLYARVEAIQYETLDTRTVTLRPGRGWQRHRAGQFLNVGVPVDGRVTTRSYSISSAPERSDGCITITVKRVPGGKVSDALFRKVKPGDHLTISQPQGAFTLPGVVPPRLLFLTAGSGITPVMSMLRSLALQRSNVEIVHLHYAPRAPDVIFADEIAELPSRLPGYRPTVITTRAEGVARFGATELDRLVPDWRERQAWACGPEALLETIEACFVVESLRDALVVEHFRPKRAPVDPNARGGLVRFGLSQKEVEAGAGHSILEAAESVEIAAPHGCRMGICHSCDVTLKKGSVRDLRTGETIDEPGARIQTCVSAACGEVEIDL